ncbi:MAG: cytidine deaminase [Candidatus Hydrothermia bacterium]
MLARASQASELACVLPDSRLRVGAALLSESGEIYLGANIESASYGLTVCAERVALFVALMAGERKFKAMAITAFKKRGDEWVERKGITPCGACRQMLAEYAPGLVIYLNDGRIYRIEELLPEAFERDNQTI